MKSIASMLKPLKDVEKHIYHPSIPQASLQGTGFTISVAPETSCPKLNSGRFPWRRWSGTGFAGLSDDHGGNTGEVYHGKQIQPQTSQNHNSTLAHFFFGSCPCPRDLLGVIPILHAETRIVQMAGDVEVASGSRNSVTTVPGDFEAWERHGFENI